MRRLIALVARFVAALLFRRLEVADRDRLPRGRPVLLVANHFNGFVDPVVIAAALGRLPRFIAKATLDVWPNGFVLRRAGVVFVRRRQDGATAGNEGAFAETHRALAAGDVVAIFPEGTTTDGQGLRTFHGRLLASAIDSGVPLQPVAIRYLRGGQPCPVAPFVGDDDMLSHLLRLLRSQAGEVQIQLLAPIASNSASRNELARQAQSRPLVSSR